MDEEALLAEMEVTGQAFDSLQEQNGKASDTRCESVTIIYTFI